MFLACLLWAMHQTENEKPAQLVCIFFQFLSNKKKLNTIFKILVIDLSFFISLCIRQLINT